MVDEHPGILFIQRFGAPQSEADIFRYADFLREEAGLDDGPLDSLDPILARFPQITIQRAKLLAGQSGCVFDPLIGNIFIAEDHPQVRQRFSEAHELMELVFGVSPVRLDPAIDKEDLCEKGGAHLLMPPGGFSARLRRIGVSLGSALRLAHEYHVSLAAALRRTVELGPGRHARIIWTFGYGVADLAQGPASRRRLRIESVYASPGADRVPVGQAVAETTSIYRTYELGLNAAAEEDLALEGLRGLCRCENRLALIGNERRVVSLIHLPGDRDCEAHAGA